MLACIYSAHAQSVVKNVRAEMPPIVHAYERMFLARVPLSKITKLSTAPKARANETLAFLMLKLRKSLKMPLNLKSRKVVP